MTTQSSSSPRLPTISRRLSLLAGALALVAAMGGTWTVRSASAAPPAASAVPMTSPTTSPARTSTGHGFDEDGPRKPVKKSEVVGKVNLNTANEEQLMMLPTVGPSKADRIVAWRKKNGGFKRIADLRRVKGFGYRTFKRLEPLLDIKGETTIGPKVATK